MLNIFKRRRKVAGEEQGNTPVAISSDAVTAGAVRATAPHELEVEVGPTVQTEVIEGNEDSDWALWADSVLALEAQDSQWLKTVSFQSTDQEIAA